MESILTSIKKLLGIEADYTHFDEELIIYINGAIGELNQIGAGVDSFTVNGITETWADLLGDRVADLAMAKTFVYLKVRLIFDPPSSSFLVSAITTQLAESAWRLQAKESL